MCLKDISFEARKGETVALVGHTGSGKSSIINLLLGFYEPDQGAITIDGRDITGISKQALRKHMGIVLQDPYLFAGDIKFNVSLYNKEITLDRVKSALQDVGAAPFIEQLPNGYDEQVVERGSTLSSGQRQLISFARALAFDPSILILDEATASIDSETEGLIQQALKVVSEGRTTLSYRPPAYPRSAMRIKFSCCIAARLSNEAIMMRLWRWRADITRCISCKKGRKPLRPQLLPVRRY